MNNKNIIAAAVVALAVFGFFALILPEYNNIKEARTALQERKAMLEERTALVAKVASLNEVYNTNQNNINKLGSLLPTNKHHDEIVSSIFSIAGQSGVVLSEVVVGDAANQGNGSMKQTNISVQGTGQYERIYNFLQLLEQSLRLYDVQSLNLGIKEGAGGAAAGNLTFEIKINTNSIN